MASRPVLRLSDRATLDQAQKDALIVVLHASVECLEARVAELEGQLSRNSAKGSKPPSSNGPAPKSHRGRSDKRSESRTEGPSVRPVLCAAAHPPPPPPAEAADAPPKPRAGAEPPPPARALARGGAAPLGAIGPRVAPLDPGAPRCGAHGVSSTTLSCARRRATPPRRHLEVRSEDPLSFLYTRTCACSTPNGAATTIPVVISYKPGGGGALTSRICRDFDIRLSTL